MITVLSLYPKSIDLEWIEQHLSTQLIPSLKQAKGFRSIKASDGHLMSPGGSPPYAKVVEFSFETLEDFMAWTQSSAAQGNKNDLIASGTLMLYYEEKDL